MRLQTLTAKSGPRDYGRKAKYMVYPSFSENDAVEKHKDSGSKISLVYKNKFLV